MSKLSKPPPSLPARRPHERRKQNGAPRRAAKHTWEYGHRHRSIRPSSRQTRPGGAGPALADCRIARRTIAAACQHSWRDGLYLLNDAMNAPANSFRAAMRQAGLDHAGPLVADGKLHRFKAAA